MTIKGTILAGIGVVGSFLSSLIGGWTTAMTTLLIFMGLDYISGLVVAGVFKKSGKSSSGGLESRAGFKGLCRKGMVLVILLVACRLDILIGASYIRDAVCIAYCANETVSIIENAALMGIPIPEIIKKAIDILKNKED